VAGPTFVVVRYLGHNDVVEMMLGTSDQETGPHDGPVLVEGAAPADGPTRERVARLLLELGPSTAASLSERLGLSSPAVRRHLDAMVAEGIISTRESRLPSRRGRGRPARLFALTDAGHAAGPTAYDDLAVAALAFLGTAAGEQAVEAFAAERAEQLAARLAARIDGPQSVEQVGAALTAEGYATTVHAVPTGTQLCQHHCPVQSVAARFPQLCEAETEALSELLGTHVQRLATIAHGDGVCTTHVPGASPGSGAAAGSTSATGANSATRADSATRVVPTTRRVSP
jgi:predicted ArsR family transcriptional regulator